MNNFDLKNFLVENKLTSNSKKISLLKEQEEIPFDAFDKLKNYWGEYPGTENLEYDDVLGVEDFVKNNASHFLKTLPTSEDWYGEGGGAENMDFHDMGDGYVLVVDDYLSSGTIHKKDELVRAIPALGKL